MLSMIDSAVAAAPVPARPPCSIPRIRAPAPVFPPSGVARKLACNSERTPAAAQKAREHHIYIQSGSMLEVDSRWAACLQYDLLDRTGRDSVQISQGHPGFRSKFTRPTRHRGYDEPLFPVADTPIGASVVLFLRLDFPRSDPAVSGQRSGVLVRVSAYMDPGCN